MSFIKELLSRKAAAYVMEQAVPNVHRKVLGKAVIVDRVRAGKVEMRKELSGVAGWKIVDGVVQKMTPDEVRNRKRAAKIAARKRKAEESRIERRRNLSLKVRKSRFGGVFGGKKED